MLKGTNSPGAYTLIKNRETSILDNTLTGTRKSSVAFIHYISSSLRPFNLKKHAVTGLLVNVEQFVHAVSYGPLQFINGDPCIAPGIPYLPQCHAQGAAKYSSIGSTVFSSLE